MVGLSHFIGIVEVLWNDGEKMEHDDICYCRGRFASDRAGGLAASADLNVERRLSLRVEAVPAHRSFDDEQSKGNPILVFQ